MDFYSVIFWGYFYLTLSLNIFSLFVEFRNGFWVGLINMTYLLAVLGLIHGISNHVDWNSWWSYAITVGSSLVGFWQLYRFNAYKNRETHELVEQILRRK